MTPQALRDLARILRAGADTSVPSLNDDVQRIFDAFRAMANKAESIANEREEDDEEMT